MKQLIFVLVFIVGVHVIAVAQESKTKVESSGYKKKVEGTHHKGHLAHYHHYHHKHAYHFAYKRHIHHTRNSYVSYHRNHVYSKPVVHYKKIKREKNGEYKAKT